LTDYAIIVVSATKNEFMSGFSIDSGLGEEKDNEKENENEGGHEGSTRQHFKILKASGCRKIIVAINKMDHENVRWSPEIFYERVAFIQDFVSKLYETRNTSDFLSFVPISAISQENVV